MSDITLLVGILLGTLSIILMLFSWYFKRKYSYWKERNIPQLEQVPFLGTFGNYILLQKSLGEETQAICRKFPNEPIIGAFMGVDPILIVQDPELIKLVMTKDFYFFSNRELSTHSHKEVSTKNLFLIYGDEWRVLRQNLTPLFSSARMKNMFYLIRNCSKDLEVLMDKETEISNVLRVEARSLMARYTIDCICSCAFGINSKAMTENIKTNPFSQMAETIGDVSLSRGLHIIARLLWPSLYYNLGFKLIPPKVNAFFDSILGEVFKERKDKPSSRQDFVDLLINLKNNKCITGDCIKNMKDSKNSEKVTLTVDDELINAQCFLFFAAGFDTSSTTSSFTLYELAKHPQIQKRCFSEVQSYLASTGGEVTYECTKELPYLSQCIEETLRLYPVLGVITREVYETYKMPNGLELKPGIPIYIPVYHLQHDPNFFPEPMKFNPERFSAEQRDKIVPYTYLPFGEGPRVCIGMRFARMQMIPGLVTILKKYRIELAEGMSPTIDLEPKTLGIVARGGINLKFISREQ